MSNTLFIESANASGVFWVSVRSPRAPEMPTRHLVTTHIHFNFSSLSGVCTPVKWSWVCGQPQETLSQGDWLNGQRPHHNQDFITQNKHVASGARAFCPSASQFWNSIDCSGRSLRSGRENCFMEWKPVVSVLFPGSTCPSRLKGTLVQKAPHLASV